MDILFLKHAAKILLIVLIPLFIVVMLVCLGLWILFILLFWDQSANSWAVFSTVSGVSFLFCIAILLSGIPLFVGLWLYRSRRYTGSLIFSAIFIIVVGSVYTQINLEGQKRREEAKENSIELATIPAGFLMPTPSSIPSGYIEKKHSFYKNHYTLLYTYTGQLGSFSVSESTKKSLCKSIGAKKPFYIKEVKPFSYNGESGEVETIPSISPSGLVGYILRWNDNDKCLTIEWNLLPTGISKSEDIIRILETFVRSQ